MLAADNLMYEQEAKEFIAEIMFPYLYGTEAPLIPEVNIPDDYEENRLRFRELIKKVYQPHDPNNPLTHPEALEYKGLVKYFKDLAKEIRAASRINPNYKKPATQDDEESE